MLPSMRCFWRDERGQSLAETSLLLAFILLVCVAVVTEFGEKVREFYANFVAAYPG